MSVNIRSRVRQDYVKGGRAMARMHEPTSLNFAGSRLGDQLVRSRARLCSRLEDLDILFKVRLEDWTHRHSLVDYV